MPAALLSLSLSLSLTPKSFILETRGNRQHRAFSIFFHHCGPSSGQTGKQPGVEHVFPHLRLLLLALAFVWVEWRYGE